MQHPEFKRAEEIAEGLFTHQIEGIAFLLGRRRALLADDMGLGKTRQSIIAMVEAEPVGSYLVICHASIKRNWAREIEIVLPNAEPAIAGPKPLPSTDFQDWVIINYEILGKNLDKLLEFDWKGVVFDEAHYLKNYQSQRSQNGAKLVQSIENNPVVHALTGTPMTSRPRDLFPILQLVDHPLGKSFFSFAKRYCDAYKGDFGLVADGASNIEELTVQLHGIMLRRTKDEVLYPINGICSARSLGPPRKADFIGKLLIKLIWYNSTGLYLLQICIDISQDICYYIENIEFRRHLDYER